MRPLERPLGARARCATMTSNGFNGSKMTK
jgi:hypothetical protein